MELEAESTGITSQITNGKWREHTRNGTHLLKAPNLQGHTSRASPNSATNWGPSYQMAGKMGAVIIQNTQPLNIWQGGSEEMPAEFLAHRAVRSLNIHFKKHLRFKLKREEQSLYTWNLFWSSVVLSLLPMPKVYEHWVCRHVHTHILGDGGCLTRPNCNGWQRLLPHLINLLICRQNPKQWENHSENMKQNGHCGQTISNLCELGNQRG